MEIQQIPLDKIKPDKDQPRRTFNQDKIREIAMTIKTVGVINPVELDKTYTLITGENRWRAAKLAGLKTIPAKVMDISKDDRFLRQVIENIQYANLTPIEIARALEKLLTRLAASLVRDKKHSGERYNKGYKELADLIGKDRDFVKMYIDLLKQSEPLQKAIEKGLPITHLTSLQSIPPKYQKTFEKKLLGGEFKTRDASRYVADAIKRSPDKAKQILDIDYSEYDSAHEVVEVISKISPKLSTMFEQAIEVGLKPPDELSRISSALHKWCINNPPESIAAFYRFQIITAMEAMIEDIGKWGKGNKLLN